MHDDLYKWVLNGGSRLNFCCNRRNTKELSTFLECEDDHSFFCFDGGSSCERKVVSSSQVEMCAIATWKIANSCFLYGALAVLEFFEAELFINSLGPHLDTVFPRLKRDNLSNGKNVFRLSVCEPFLKPQ